MHAGAEPLQRWRTHIALLPQGEDYPHPDVGQSANGHTVAFSLLNCSVLEDACPYTGRSRRVLPLISCFQECVREAHTFFVGRAGWSKCAVPDESSGGNGLPPVLRKRTSFQYYRIGRNVPSLLKWLSRRNGAQQLEKRQPPFVNRKETPFSETRTLFIDCFSLCLPGFQITDVVSTAGSVLILARSMHPAASCPVCHQESLCVHSYYQHSPQDLPVSGQMVRLVLQVWRFRCLNSSCPQRTFAERLPEVVAFAVRRTVRLTSLLRIFAIQCAGEAGAQVLSHVGTQVSPDTLLRLAKAAPALSFRVPSILGVVDFALRKGRSYGPLLIDWEQRRPIDLLPDRMAETLAHWLQSHPGAKWISRDRSTEYARGAALGAPEAQQVVDLWHLQKNWRETLQRVLNRVRARLTKLQAHRGTRVGGQGTRERSSTERRTSQLSREERIVNRY